MRVASNPTLHGWGHWRRRWRWVECNGSDLKGVERVVSAQYKSSSKNSGIFRRLVTRGEWSLAHWSVRSRESSRNPCTAPFSGEETSVKTPSSFSLEGGGAHQCLFAAGRSAPDASVCPATRILDEPEPTREVSPRTPARLSACASHPQRIGATARLGARAADKDRSCR